MDASRKRRCDGSTAASKRREMMAASKIRFMVEEVLGIRNQSSLFTLRYCLIILKASADVYLSSRSPPICRYLFFLRQIHLSRPSTSSIPPHSNPWQRCQKSRHWMIMISYAKRCHRWFTSIETIFRFSPKVRLVLCCYIGCILTVVLPMATYRFPGIQKIPIRQCHHFISRPRDPKSHNTSTAS